jgi:hypothetical protein
VSTLKHATVSSWQRAEDGSYQTESGGWMLRVRWRPESPEHRRGFLWQAEGPTGARAIGREVQEEIEIAMQHAEDFAAGGDAEHRRDGA